jgi:hypothetical protein
MKLETALSKHAAAKRSLRAAGETVDRAIRTERDAGRTIPELMKLTGLSYRGVYLALNRAKGVDMLTLSDVPREWRDYAKQYGIAEALERAAIRTNGKDQ